MEEIFSLKGKLAVITGGAGLLGQKHAEAIVQAGGQVVLVDINKDALDAAAAKLPKETICVSCDITDENMVKRTRNIIKKRLRRRPDILINNAAIDPKFEKNSKINKSRLENFDINQWNTELSVGLTGAMICTKIFGADMADAGGGVILNIASDLGVIAPDQRLYRDEKLADEMQNVKPVTYSVIKHGLIGLTKYTATYWADKGVRCNSLVPGGVFNNHPDEFVQRISSLIPMGRMADIDEYKGAVIFICSGAGSYMNGASLVLDGGRSIW